MDSISNIDKKKLLPLLDKLVASIEEFAISGLTVASDSTRKTLAIAFQEASRMRLLRLGSTLRVANDELTRYINNDPEFSVSRLSFFLNRSWLLGNAIKKAINEDDSDELRNLLWMPSSKKVEELQLVTMGVVKRVTSLFCAFEFRLRTISDSAIGEKGQKLTWSAIFPIKKDSEIPPEGYLHLPQKQNFKAKSFLEHKIISIENASVSIDKYSNSRLSLLPESKVSFGDQFDDWSSYLLCDYNEALERVKKQATTPLDLEVELSEEVVIPEWNISDNVDDEKTSDENSNFYPLRHSSLVFNMQFSTRDKDQDKKLRLLKKSGPSSNEQLYGIYHYENCKFVLNPLTLFQSNGPKYLQISEGNIDQTALLRALNLT